MPRASVVAGMRACILASLLVLSVGCGQVSGRPTAVASPSVGPLLFAVLEANGTANVWTYNTVAIAGLDGYARAKTTFSPMPVPVLGCMGAVLPLSAHVAAGKVFFADSKGVVRSLAIAGRRPRLDARRQGQGRRHDHQARSRIVRPERMHGLGLKSERRVRLHQGWSDYERWHGHAAGEYASERAPRGWNRAVALHGDRRERSVQPGPFTRWQARPDVLRRRGGERACVQQRRHVVHSWCGILRLRMARFADCNRRTAQRSTAAAAAAARLCGPDRPPN